MKTSKVAIVTAIAIMAAIGLGKSTIVCPLTKTVPMPDWADPNQVNYKLMAAFEQVEGSIFSKRIWACDPDGNALVFGLNGEPNGMLIGPFDPNEAELAWRSCVEGIYYIDVYIMDLPDFNQPPEQDDASFILRVYTKNKPPIFGGCR